MQFDWLTWVDKFFAVMLLCNLWFCQQLSFGGSISVIEIDRSSCSRISTSWYYPDHLDPDSNVTREHSNREIECIALISAMTLLTKPMFLRDHTLEFGSNSVNDLRLTCPTVSVRVLPFNNLCLPELLNVYIHFSLSTTEQRNYSYRIIQLKLLERPMRHPMSSYVPQLSKPAKFYRMAKLSIYGEVDKMPEKNLCLKAGSILQLWDLKPQLWFEFRLSICYHHHPFSPKIIRFTNDVYMKNSVTSFRQLVLKMT